MMADVGNLPKGKFRTGDVLGRGIPTHGIPAAEVPTTFEDPVEFEPIDGGEVVGQSFLAEAQSMVREVLYEFVLVPSDLLQGDPGGDDEEVKSLFVERALGGMGSDASGEVERMISAGALTATVDPGKCDDPESVESEVDEVMERVSKHPFLCRRLVTGGMDDAAWRYAEAVVGPKALPREVESSK